jgi:hypothetical protein
VAAALASPTDAAAASSLARALSSDGADRAQALRREAAGLRAAGGALPVPPSRRAVVARYLSARHVERSEDAPR